MKDMTAVLELVARLGEELDFDVARNVVGLDGRDVDVVWFHRLLPLAMAGASAPDLRVMPVLPTVAFGVLAPDAADTAPTFDIVERIEAAAAPLSVVLIARPSGLSRLAPALKSVERLAEDDEDAALRDRLVDALQQRPRAHASRGRTIVMLQTDLVDWARRVRDAKPRSYSAESLFDRTGGLD